MNTGESNSLFAKKAWIRALERTAGITRDRYVTLPTLVSRWGLERAGALALVSSESTLSYGELARRSHRYARWGLAQGLRRGDVVALVLGNCAEYLAVWLGLTRIGATVALVNTQLPAEGLLHCIRIVAPKLVIAGAAHLPVLRDVRSRLPPATACWSFGLPTSDFAALDAALLAFDDSALTDAEATPPAVDATALYIYTSGTTGLPKAARVSHLRVMQWSHWFAGMLDTSPDDRMYDCLPFYHSVGGVVATGATLVGGGTVIIRPRFSASDFWQDIRHERCTLFQYIGELCRYLVNAPSQELEAEHTLRLVCGNGLRPEIWETFQSRFRIPRVLEYYASTEGNFSLYNCEGEIGAIGRIPSFMAQRLPVALLRFDPDTGEPWRNPEGLCQRCETDEVGEAVGLIPDTPQGQGGRFEGYADGDATASKVLRDVFRRGDRWYRTGDLMRCDARGFYYFVDRIGDTYRWKGENVSTTEVSGVIATCPGVIESVVYGAAVSGCEGRAGMAAIVVGDRFDLAELHRHLAARLPGYARPVFLRVTPALESTGTFKPRKQELARAGFDPGLVADPLYFDDPRAGVYVALDSAVFETIQRGDVRF